MWKVLNAFPRPSHPEDRQVPAHPIQAVTCGRKWFLQTSSLLDSLPPTEKRGKSASAKPSVRSWQEHTLPSSLQRAEVLFCPFLLQPGMLACFLSRNLKVGSQGLSCMLPSAFSVQVLRRLTGYISRFHFLPFLLWTAARGLSYRFFGFFLTLWMVLPLQNTGAGIHFNLFFNWKKPS
jgi:hypothetical protein